MKLTTFILLLTLMQVSAATLAQRVTLKEQDAPLKSVLKSIREQSGYDFFYDGNLITTQQKVTVDLRNASVEDALASLLRGTGLDYSIEGKIISIRKKEAPSLIEKISTFFARIDLRGQVVDETGKPMPGVTVKLKDNSQATVTDGKGEFFLKKVDENAVLVFSFIGYQTFESAPSADLGQIRLQPSTSKLDEVQVLAYSKTTLRMNTGNVSTVNAKDIEKSPVTNILQALQGRVPGLKITTVSGFNNGGVSFEVQGKNSINARNNPYIVVDGVPFTETLQYNMGDEITGGTSSLSFINPNDIESVSVLKDADATAIYGSRAANGAILITTKKGNKGATKVDLNYQQGINLPARTVKLLNTQQYLQMRHEAIKNDGVAIKPTDYDINGLWDTTRYTNWQKELIGQTAGYTNLNASVSGGNNQMSYLVGTTFNRQTTVLPGDFDDKKVSLHFNINASSPNQKFKMQFSGSFLNDNNTIPNQDLTGLALKLAPNAPALYNADGSLNWALNASGNSSWGNPLASLLQKITDRTQSLASNAVLSYELARGLQLKGTVGYNSLITNQVTQVPVEIAAPESQADQVPLGFYMNNRSVNWIAEPQLTYQRSLPFGNFNFLLGATIQQSRTESQSLRGEGYPSSASIADINAAGSIYNEFRTLPELYKYSGVFANINYDYQGKYLVNFTGRRDGSSRFGDANKYHVFGAAGLGWVFSEENFLKNNKVLSFGKLKASYGTTGNDRIGNYAYLSLYQVTTPDIPYGNGTSLGGNEIANPYLQWEETRKLNFGADLGFWKDRVLLGVNYFRNRTSNQLLTRSMPATTGALFLKTNLPAIVQNSGWEFTAASTNIKSSNFQWSTNFNLTIPRNKLVRYDDIEETGDASLYVVGQPLSITRLYHYWGVDPQTGAYMVADKNGNPTATPDFNEDAIILVDKNQRFYGGMENSLSYKNIQFSFLLSFVKQIGANNFVGSNPGRVNTNVPVELLDRWQKPGDIAEHQRYNSNNSLSSNRGLVNSSDKAISDASYIRLKNVSIAYSIPSTWQQKMHMSGARLFIHAQNWLTFTRYKGLDPETLALNRLPPVRTIILGCQASF